MHIYLKTNPELTPEEINQLQEMVNYQLTDATPDYVERTILQGPLTKFLIIEDEGLIQGISAIRDTKMQTPFAKRPLTVEYHSFAYKRKGYRGNVLWKVSKWYLRKYYGPFWWLRTSVGLTNAISPKLYENYAIFFPEIYPTPQSPDHPEVRSFIQEFQETPAGFGGTLLPDQSIANPNFTTQDITDSYERAFAAKDEALNQWFFDLGILERQGDRILRHNRTLCTVGFRGPKNLPGILWSVWKSFRRSRSKR